MSLIENSQSSFRVRYLVLPLWENKHSNTKYLVGRIFIQNTLRFGIRMVYSFSFSLLKYETQFHFVSIGNKQQGRSYYTSLK
jgi:hypothetical protein